MLFVRLRRVGAHVWLCIYIYIYIYNMLLLKLYIRYTPYTTLMIIIVVASYNTAANGLEIAWRRCLALFEPFVVRLFLPGSVNGICTMRWGQGRSRK